jgi:hypothetical protein
MEHHHAKQSGSVFIELLWTIPLFIAGIVLIILVGVHLNAKSALQDAVTHALSLATTRGYSAQLLYAPFARVTDYANGDKPFEHIKDLLVSSQKLDSPEDLLLASYRSALGGVQLNDLGTSELLALVYVNQAVSLASLGEAVFPCSADDQSMGCLRCFFVPTATGVLPLAIDVNILDDLSTAAPQSQMSMEVRDRESKQRLEMWCSYRPKNVFLSIAMGLAQASGFTLDPTLGTIQVKGAADAFAGF